MIKGTLHYERGHIGATELSFRPSTRIWTMKGNDWLAEVVYSDCENAVCDFGVDAVSEAIGTGKPQPVVYRGEIPEHWMVR